MAKDGGSGSSFAPGAVTVARADRARDQESRTDRFGPPHPGAADPTARVWEPAGRPGRAGLFAVRAKVLVPSRRSFHNFQTRVLRRVLMPDTIWQRMGQLTLQRSACASQFSDPESTVRDLQAAFTVLDVGRYQGQSQAVTPFSLRSASFPHGDVVISTFAGSALHSHLRSESLAFLVLPGRGVGAYRLLGERLSICAGEVLGYLPPCEFAVTNSVTCGTLIGFTLASLQRRLAAIAGERPVAEQPDVELLRPALIEPVLPQQAFLVHAILDVLRLIEQSVEGAAGPPAAALALDDLLLRCIALLLRPESPRAWREAPRDLQAAVDLVMSWMLANLERPISLTHIEEQAGYGRRSLQMAFRERVGCGPMQWLRRQRLEAAHSLIQALAAGSAPPLSIAEVGRRCGYINLSAFSRDFSSRFGVAPSRLLRQAR